MKHEKFEPLVTSRIKAFISIIKDVFVVRDTNPSDKQQEGYGIKASKEYPKGRNTLYRKVLNMAIIAFSPKTKKDSYMAIKPKDPNILNESVWGDPLLSDHIFLSLNQQNDKTSRYKTYQNCSCLQRQSGGVS